jgi:hypothetical protein
MNSGLHQGAKCAYCHTVIRGSDEIAECSDCETIMHVDCWNENGACVQPGCAGHGVQRDDVPIEIIPAGEPADGDAHGRGVLIAAFSILAVAAVLAVVAISAKLLSDDGPPTIPATTAAQKEPAAAKAASASDQRDAELATDIRRVFREIDKGHWQGAVNHLAAPEISDLEESGAPAVIFKSAYTPHDLVGNIQPNRIAVSRVQVDGKEAEFLLAVPYSDNRCFKGVTWAQHEHGEWRYDPSTYNRPGRESLGRHGLRVRPIGC